MKIAIIKSNTWSSSALYRKHPEYSAIFKLIEEHRSKAEFLLIGSSNTATSTSSLGGAAIVDIQGNRIHDLVLLRVLLQSKPDVVIVLGLLEVIPVSLYCLLSTHARYLPVFIGLSDVRFSGRDRIVVTAMTSILIMLGLLMKLSARRTLDMLALSNHDKKVAESLITAARGRVRLVSYPVSEIFHPQERPSFPQRHEHPKLLTVAGIEPRKGIDVLLHALSLIADKYEMVIKGGVRDKKYMTSLLKIRKELGLEKCVAFDTREYDYDDLPSLYNSSEIFILPSRGETLGVVILEALSCGVPVIATHVGGIPDMIQHQVNGILVPPDRPDRLATAISVLLNSPSLREEFAKKGRSVLEKRYYADRVTLADAFKDSVEKYESGLGPRQASGKQS